MRVPVRWALALVGATALVAPATAQTSGKASAPAITRTVAVAGAAEHTVPDSADADSGLEAREAMADPSAAATPSGASEVAQVMASTLNAQYAAAQPAPIAAPAVASIPATSVAQVVPAFAAAPAAQLLPAVISVSTSAAPAAALAPEAPSAGPSVALAKRVVESAEAFADYMGRASAMRPDYADPAGVTRAVDSGGIYEFGQLQEGAIAYVTLVALQDPEFVRSVDALAREGYRDRLIGALAANPRAIMQMPSSADAAARAAKALGRMGSALLTSGAAFKQSAYDMQHQAWSRTPVATPAAMLAELKARSALREVMAQDNGQAMLGTLVQLRGADADGGSGRLTPVVAQGLTLAALAVLGEAGEEHADRVSNLLGDATSAQCLKMARLNFYQCLSVAGPSYEDAFCLGQHAMMETAHCVADASGWSAPARGVAVPVAAMLAPSASSVPSSVMVPVALNTGVPPVDPQVAASGFADPAAAGDPNDVTPDGAPPPMGAPGQLSMQIAGMEPR